jgi:hypothetical protein
MKQYRFKIVTEKLKNGKLIITPKAKEPGLFTSWQQITKIYDEYVLFDFPGQHNLTMEDALNHIIGFKQQLELKNLNSVIEIRETELAFNATKEQLDDFLKSTID